MKKGFYVVCDNIRSLENIGSIFRTADAVGITKVFLCGISGTPPNHKISKTALGADRVVPFEHFKQTWRVVGRLKAQKVKIVVLEQNKKSVKYSEFKFKFPMALVVGNEIKGVSKKVISMASQLIYLPMCGTKESLNVSVAFGVAAYEINKYRK